LLTVDFKRISLQSGDKVLDIGCGTGRHTCAAARFEGVVAIGVDVQLSDVAEAKNRLTYQDQTGTGNDHWGLSVADILRLPFTDNCFDLVICSEVLEHIPDHQAAISEIVRVLKPGKDMVVSVPRYLPERICWFLSKDYHNANNGHIRIYKKEDLIRLLADADVRILGCHWAHSLHTPYWWLKCIVGPTRENSVPVEVYHRFLVWDMMKRPAVTQLLEYILNPLLGKSLVLYLKKSDL
jgi:SAM-dependent methyltransferase